MSNQQSLPLGSLTFTQRANKISRQASKRRRLPVLQPSLLADSGFTPREGVPKTRADCPDTSKAPCDRVRCRYHLFLEDAEHRAGRPGLSSVRRDERGLTTSQPGDAGDARPGTTLRPGWLRVRGLELEREVKVYVSPDLELCEVRNGTLDYWLKHTHAGEPLLAYDTVTLGLGDEPLMLAQAELTADGRVKFDRELPEYVVNGSSALLLRRVRPVASCALDEIAKRGKLSNEQTGDGIARHRTLVGREVRVALKKACEEAERQGMSVDDFLGALRGLGDK